MEKYTENDKWLEILHKVIMIYLALLGFSFLIIGNADSKLAENSMISMFGFTDGGSIFVIWFLIGALNIGLIYIIWKVIYSYLEDVKIIKKTLITSHSIKTNPSTEFDMKKMDNETKNTLPNPIDEISTESSTVKPDGLIKNSLDLKETDLIEQQLNDLLKQYNNGQISNEYYNNAKSYLEQKLSEIKDRL